MKLLVLILIIGLTSQIWTINRIVYVLTWVALLFYVDFV